jgi:hypothetical protein
LAIFLPDKGRKVEKAMGISIKNPKVERLVREYAQKTGKGQTEAIETAMEEALARLDKRGLAERLLEIAQETAPILKGLDLQKETDKLYDYLHEDGGSQK